VIRSKDKTVARNKLIELQSQLRDRGDIPTDSTTVQQWFTYWLEQIAVKEVRPKTLAGYRSTVYGHVIPGLGESTRLNRVNAGHMRALEHRIVVEKKLSSTYAHNAHVIAAASFEVAVKEGRLMRNPAKLVTAPRKNVRDLDVLDLDEALHLLEVIANRPDGARWAMSLLTGARRGEVLGLQRDRVTDSIDFSWQLQALKHMDGVPIAAADFEYRHIQGTLFLTRPKSRAGWRVIPLVEPLKSVLERHLESQPDNKWGLVFTEGGLPRHPEKDSTAWRDLMQATFGAHRSVRLHDLRHAAVDLMYLAGVPEDLIIEVVGHSTRAMTRSYKSRGNQDRLRAALQAYGAMLTPAEPSRTPEISE
jgi:integrase